MSEATADEARRRARMAEIAAFLADSAWHAAEVHAFAADASFRRYFRLTGGPRPALLMDAPPPEEDVRPWLRIGAHLRALGLSAPEVYAADEARGLLVIEDFGDTGMAPLLATGGDREILYAAAVDTLIALHRAPQATRIEIGRYDLPLLIEKAELLLDWFMPAMGLPVSAEARDAYRAAWQTALAARTGVPETLALRDYFPENLMWLPARADVRRCGLLDFQDALLAPTVYDLVSLLEDARRDVPDPIRDAMTRRYLAAFPEQDAEAFAAAAAVMAAQRHARVIGVFARLSRRDGKHHYLAHVPRVWRLLERAVRHPALASVADWFAHHVRPAYRRSPGAP